MLNPLNLNFLTPQLVLNLLAGVKLSDASKKLGKKFATGASVVKVRFTCLWQSEMFYRLLAANFYWLYIILCEWLIPGPNWEGANWCSRGHILWYCGIHYRDMARCNHFCPNLFYSTSYNESHMFLLITNHINSLNNTIHQF